MRVSGVMVVAYKREVLAKNLEALKHVTIATNGVFLFVCLFACLTFSRQLLLEWGNKSASVCSKLLHGEY